MSNKHVDIKKEIINLKCELGLCTKVDSLL